jgi:hypothetical protein
LSGKPAGRHVRKFKDTRDKNEDLFLVSFDFQLCYNFADMIIAAASIYSQMTATGFWNQPVDIILYDILVWFGWVPIMIVMVWGCVQVWLALRQEKWVGSLQYSIMAVDVPAVTEQTPKSLENMFASLWGAYSTLTWKEKWVLGKTQPLFTFEIASHEGYVQFYIRTLTRYRDVAEAGIYAAYPEAEITEVEDYTNWAPGHFPDDEWNMWGTELKLKNPEIFPLRTYLDFEDKISGELKDPLGGILEQLAKMKPGEHFWIQIIIQPYGNDWKKAGETFINKTFGVEPKHKPGLISSALDGVMAWPSAITNEALGIALVGEHGETKQEDIWKAFKITMAEKEQVEGVLKKIGKVGYRTKMRLVYIGRKGAYNKLARTAFVKGMFNQFSHLNLNALGLHGDATPKDDYFWQAWTYTAKQGRLLRAYKGRSWGTGATPWTLNVEELATLWHFPSLLVKAPLVKKAEAKRSEPPVGLPIGSDDEDIYQKAPLRSHVPDASVSSDHGQDVSEMQVVDDIRLPGMDAVPDDLIPVASVHAAPSDEERELGLDSTDVGPPADIVLPGPPPGWVPEPDVTDAVATNDDNKLDVPPNLPV